MGKLICIYSKGSSNRETLKPEMPISCKAKNCPGEFVSYFEFLCFKLKAGDLSGSVCSGSFGSKSVAKQIEIDAELTTHLATRKALSAMGQDYPKDEEIAELVIHQNKTTVQKITGEPLEEGLDKKQ